MIDTYKNLSRLGRLNFFRVENKYLEVPENPKNAVKIPHHLTPLSLDNLLASRSQQPLEHVLIFCQLDEVINDGGRQTSSALR